MKAMAVGYEGVDSIDPFTSDPLIATQTVVFDFIRRTIDPQIPHLLEEADETLTVRRLTS